MAADAFYLSNRYRHRCFCGRFITLSKRYGWEAGGEFGEETFYICPRCLDEGTTPQGHNGSSDARWCGISNGDNSK